MAPISPGEMPGPPKRRNLPTASTKAHRFESFSKRISRLKINPIHRVDRNRPIFQDDTLTQSHFRQSIERWSDLNLSQTFTEFSKKTTPLSESLPQLLHHADTIHGLLIEYIGRQEPLAMEPLLDLAAQFAHDLGQRFEQYFASTVALVAKVAAAHSTPEVIEWSFTCLAYIFKFLSRLLVPDLRPLLGIMIPYLGASKQKDYVVQFAAESLSFLLRKAAVLYPKDTNPLTTAVSYLLAGVDVSDIELCAQGYQTGLMTLFSESLAGVDGGSHSSGNSLLSCLIDSLLADPAVNDLGLPILEGVLVSAIHRTDREGFHPLLQTILVYVSKLDIASSLSDFFLVVRLLLLSIGTRKGSRVFNWHETIESLVHLGGTLAYIQSPPVETQNELLKVIAVAMQYSPMDCLIPFVDPLLGIAEQVSSPLQFFAFCEIFASMGSERFQTLLLPRFQQYVLTRWSENESALQLLLHTLSRSACVTRHPGNPGYFTCPGEWETSILDRLESKAAGCAFDSLAKTASFTLLGCAIHFPRQASNQERLRDVLLGRLNFALTEETAFDHPASRLALGPGFQAYLELSPSEDVFENQLIEFLTHPPVQALRFATFLSILADYLKSRGSGFWGKSDGFKFMRSTLIRNLTSESHRLKIVSLRLLHQLYRATGAWETKAVIAAQEILSLQYNVQNVRQIAMLLRGLPKQQKTHSGDPLSRDILPSLCMGLLSTYNGQLRKDVCAALAEMCNQPQDEEFILNLALQWLQMPGDPSTCATGNSLDAAAKKITPFQCSNIEKIADMSKVSFARYVNADKAMAQQIEELTPIDSANAPVDGRLISLQFLQSVPGIAEKRSRLLVPVFLSSQVQKDYISVALPSDTSASSHTLSPELKEGSWSLTDRKAFLELIGRFNNPTVLFKTHEVYDALLETLTSGNGDMQRLGLKALLTWKNRGVKPYEEQLLRILDDKTYRDELAVLFHADSEHSPINPEDRSALLPVLLRILYGRLVGKVGSHGTQDAKRKFILRMLFRLKQSEISQFLDIAFGRLANTKIVINGQLQVHLLLYDLIPADQQYGQLRMILTLMETMRAQLSPFAATIVHPVLYCTARACHQINEASETAEVASLTRNIRRVGLQCLDMMFKCFEDVQWSDFIPIIFEELVRPRLKNFSIETAQGISGLLRLISTWASSPKLVSYLGRESPSLLATILGCLRIPSARDEVKLFVLDQVLMPTAVLANEASDQLNEAATVMQASIESVVESIGLLLQQRPADKIVESAVSVLPILTRFTSAGSRTLMLLELLVSAVKEPSRRVSPRLKGKLLHAIQGLLDTSSSELNLELAPRILEVVSSSFNYFNDSPNRKTLSEILGILALQDDSLAKIAKICLDLNASSSSTLEDIDFDRRLQAFDAIDKLNVDSVDASRWQPLLYNMLYYSRTEADFSIRSNAVARLKGFVERACNSRIPALQETVRLILLPAFRKGIRDDSELTRADYVSLFGLVVQYLGEAPDLEDMKVLLVGGDAEASFFNNVLHIQQHRRIRAIRRLLTETQNGKITASNISSFFLPLIEKFIFDAGNDESAQNLKGQCIIAVGSLLQWVEWNQFRAIFRRYRSYLDSKSHAEKDVIKLIGVSADALEQATNTEIEVNVPAEQPVSHLSRSLPSKPQLVKELKTNFVPNLTAFVHLKDDSQISLRVPAAITTVKLLKILPDEDMGQMIPPILLDVSQILRSQAQEARDAARNTLAQISLLLGPASIQFILRELRTALTRGSQLHVLSYTMHSLLVASAPELKAGALDGFLSDLVSVVIDDIFGTVGQEKSNENYLSSMKEVKSNKSYDSMELLAKFAGLQSMAKLIQPMQVLLSGNLNSKQGRQIDELFRRVGSGLIQNAAAGSRDLLTFAYELIQDFYRQRTGPAVRAETNDESNRKRFLVHLSSAGKATTSSSTTMLFKIARFALDIVRSTFQKHEVLLTPENASGFLPIIGDAIVEAQEDIKISAMRLLTTIIRLSIPDLDQYAIIYVKEAVKTVKNSTFTNDEASQAALKLVTSILRERRDVEINNSDIAYLLHRIMPDLEEPDLQGITFNFVKVLMARKFVAPEVYELMDRIGIMMITNHGASARDAARGAFVYFLLEYPQSRGRWSKQLNFLIKNLDYKHPEGRQSVMEGVNTLLVKAGDDIAQEIVSSFFIPIVLIISNDESSRCQDMAAALLGQLFKKADKERLKSLLESLRSWTNQIDNLALARMGIRAYGKLFEVMGSNVEKEVSHALNTIEKVLLIEFDNDTGKDEQEAILSALELMLMLTKTNTASVMTKRQGALWDAIFSLFGSSNLAMKRIAATLAGSCFEALARANTDNGSWKIPLRGPYGLQLDSDTLTGILRANMRILRCGAEDAELMSQVARNVAFLGRLADSTGLTMDIRRQSEHKFTDDNEDESENSDESDRDSSGPRTITAVKYLFDQSARGLRQELSKARASALVSKQAITQVLKTIVPQLSEKNLLPSLQALLLPLQHLTDPATPSPKSVDPEFPGQYSDLVAGAQDAMEAIQHKIGGEEYLKAMIQVARTVRERRNERRTKRRIEAVSEPERFAQEKRRKNDRKKDRKKELAGAHRKRRKDQ